MGHPNCKLDRRLLINMNVGFWGAQVANGLQTANASAIFESLGADASQLPLLWLGAPVMGLVVHPVVGELSDRTWTRWGRRQPYFLLGAILGFIAIGLMPLSVTLWQAFVIYWVLQFAINLGVAPARPFIGDVLPPRHRTLGYSVQGVCIGLGTVIASLLPWLLEKLLRWESETTGIPQAICWAYYLGAALYLISTLWTFSTVTERPPEPATEAPADAGSAVISAFQKVGQAITTMPKTMRQLASVQIVTWFGVYCIFLYLPTAIAINVLGASDQQSPEYVHGIEWAGVCIAFYNLVCLGVSFMIPWLSRWWGRVATHAVFLMCGAVGVLSLTLIHDRWPLLLAMVGIGIAWAGILSIPYALLIDDVPDHRSGVYMGLFNSFLALPQIVMSLGFGWVMSTVLHGDRLWALVLGGIFFAIGALLMLRVTDPATAAESTAVDAAEISKAEKALAIASDA